MTGMLAACVAVAVVALAVPASAQDQPAPAQSVQARHDELQKFEEALADPDPLTRLATMEQAVQSGDATETYLALRTALSSDDPGMRDLAMRVWLSTLKRLTLDVVLPTEMQKVVDDATTDPKQGNKPLTFTWLKYWASRGFQISFGFTGVDVGKNGGKVFSLPGGTEQSATDFSVSGTQIEIVTSVWFPIDPFPKTCSFRFAPTAKLTLEGTASCSINGDPSPRLAVKGPMF